MTTIPLLAAFALLPAAGPRLTEGDLKSPVRVQIYEDLQCPDCAEFRLMLDGKLLPKYAGKVAFEHFDFPLAKHSWARRAAVASRFFQDVSPELAVKFRKFMLAGIPAATSANFNERLADFAKNNGCDPAQAVAALEDDRYATAVERDFKEGVARGVSKTPTVFVNGRAFVETFSFEDVSQAIDAELAQ
jgi:protein-disulfide isomerase